MLVTPGEFTNVVEKLERVDALAVDCETTGLRPYKGDELFSISFATEDEEFYFDFLETLPRSLLPGLSGVFARKVGVLIGHNLKFDLHFLIKEGLEINRALWCTQVMARIEYNEHLKYGLDDCGERIGIRKDDAVKKYMDENGLWEWEQQPGKKSKKKRYFFHKVPLEIIAPYAEKDARIAFELYRSQCTSFTEMNQANPAAPELYALTMNESKLLRVCVSLEKHGMLIDRKYCEEALSFEKDRASDAARRFKDLTGVELIDSAKVLRSALRPFGVQPGKTPGGRDSFDEASLKPYKEIPAVAAILEHREAQKRANTYFANYLHLADKNDRIHSDLAQAATATGRFANRDPNLQNVGKAADKEAKYPVRRAFIPDAGGWLVSIDFSQMEYRLMLDYAQEMSVIQEVIGGKDLHQAFADIIGVERSVAKNINFALLYGAGVQKFADMSGVSFEKAQQLRQQYFRALPNVQKFIRKVIQTAERRGYIWNWMGRRCFFPDPRFAYKAPNYLIQGGSADIAKLALVNCSRLLEEKSAGSKLLINVHDEGLFWVPFQEKEIIPELVDTMEKAYPAKLLPMKCSAAFSEKSWGDLEEGMPA